MKDGKFRLKGKEEFEAMSFEEKTQYFQELMRELKQREEELEQLNLKLSHRSAKAPDKPADSQGSQ